MKRRLNLIPSRGMFILVTLIAAAIVAGWWLAGNRTWEVAEVEQAGESIFPDFQSQLDAATVTQLEIARAAGTVTLTRGEDGKWKNSGDDTPASEERVLTTNLSVARLRYIAPRTKRAASYEKLQVEDINTTAKSTRLTYRDAAGVVLADIIIGRQKSVTGQPSVYVRRPDDVQAWLAEGIFDVHHDTEAWAAPEPPEPPEPAPEPEPEPQTEQ